MSNFTRWKSGTALILLLGITTTTVTPIVAPILTATPVFAQSSSFRDVSSGYWARDFINALASRDIIAGFPDGTFRPEAPVTRAQFAAMVRKAFNRPKIRNAVNFVDVPSRYWGYTAIREAYEMGFLAGYPGNVFSPDQNIPREQVLVSLANGLNYSARNSVDQSLQTYRDAVEISSYARNSIAAATERSIVVNYPSVNFLNPTRNATRAEVAAFIYQALVSAGEVAVIDSPYIVGFDREPDQPSVVAIPAGTSIPVRYEKQRILVTPDEKAPLTLTVAANVTTSDGRVLIPAGSQVVGELQPAQGGSQFVARELVLTNGKRQSMDATSSVITKSEEVRRGSNVGNIIRNTALGAAAAAGVSAVTGDRAIATEEVLGGAAIGTLTGLFLGRDRIKLIVVEPNTDLDLRLNKDLVVSNS